MAIILPQACSPHLEIWLWRGIDFDDNMPPIKMTEVYGVEVVGGRVTGAYGPIYSRHSNNGFKTDLPLEIIFMNGAARTWETLRLGEPFLNVRDGRQSYKTLASRIIHNPIVISIIERRRGDGEFEEWLR